MHELSIAQSIVETVQQHVRAADYPNVRTVRLQVGALAGVVADSLEFSYMAITADTALAGSRLKIEHVPFTVECNSCRKAFENELGMTMCPTCGGMDTMIVSGTELLVMDIELSNA